MSGRSKSEALAFYEGKALRQQKAEMRAKAIQAAVANVLSGACDNCKDAARGQGVPVGPVRELVKAAKAARGGR